MATWYAQKGSRNIDSVSGGSTSDVWNPAGAVMMVGWSGPDCYTADGALAAIARFNPVGVILYARNVHPEADGFAQTLERIRSAPTAPLLFVDQEGGRVSRLPVLSGQPAPRALADEAAAYGAALEAGRALKAIGIDCNLAPVLDVADTGPMASRSYGGSAERVAALGAATIRGYRDAGVACCAKHFPGLGHASVDPHVAAPVVDLDADTLRQRDLLPFAEAIKAGVDCVMVAHATYTALDSRLATYSRVLIGDVLRGELGFSGVVVTDSLDMAPIIEGVGPGEAAVRAIEAGCDLLCLPHNAQTQQQCFDALGSAVREGRISEERIAESAARIARLRRPADG